MYRNVDIGERVKIMYKQVFNYILFNPIFIWFPVIKWNFLHKYFYTNMFNSLQLWSGAKSE